MWIGQKYEKKEDKFTDLPVQGYTRANTGYSERSC